MKAKLTNTKIGLFRLNKLIQSVILLGWNDAKKSLPKEADSYIVYSPSRKSESISIAWYDPKRGWGLLPHSLADAITHWRKKPNPPPQD